MTTTIENITARRKLLGISLDRLARAARISNSAACRPGPEHLGRLDRALRLVEEGGSLHDARHTVGPVVAVVGANTGQITGQCFADAPTRDGGLFRHDRPASLIFRRDD
jgi:hypothetical protein